MCANLVNRTCDSPKLQYRLAMMEMSLSGALPQRVLAADDDPLTTRYRSMRNKSQMKKVTGLFQSVTGAKHIAC